MKKPKKSIKKKEKIKAKGKDKKKEIVKPALEKEKFKIPKKKKSKRQIVIIILAIFIGLIDYFITRNYKHAGVAFIISIVVFEVYFFINKSMKKAARIKKIEEVFPDFIELMAANLRAGMTIDKALLLSSRKEFSPLDEEILIMGKEIVTGIEISHSLSEMAKRTKSEKIVKTIAVINSGIRSGGNLAILLEQTAVNMRERGFVEKRAASNVLMYVIFIFFAISVGAPILFSLSAVLVQVLTNILGNLPPIDASINAPFTLTSINISVSFVMYFSVIFLILIDILASLLLGLIGKGRERAGLKYILPLVTVSLTSFFLLRTFLLSYLSDVG